MADSDDEWRPDPGSSSSSEHDESEGPTDDELEPLDLDEQDEDEQEDDEAGADELEAGLFGGGLDPLRLLEGMGAQAAGAASGRGLQPYEILAQARGGQAGPSQAAQAGSSDEEQPPPKKKRGRKPKAASAVRDLQELDAALGLTNKGRQKMRARRQRRRKALMQGKKTRELPEEVHRLLGEGNMLYVTGRHRDAINVFMEVLKVAPNLADPYHTLGLLHEALGEQRKALDFLMIAAHMKPKEVERWRRLASLSAQLGFSRQAIYCLNKVIARDKEDTNARWERACLFMELDEPKKAAAAFEQLLAARPGDGEVVTTLVRLRYHLGQSGQAAALLEAHLAACPLASDLTHVNLLAELRMEAGDWAAALAAIQGPGRQLAGGGELPVDLHTKAGICLLHLGRAGEAQTHFQALLAATQEGLDDFFMDAGEALLETGHAAEALALFKKVAGEAVGPDRLFPKLAACHLRLGDVAAALAVHRAAMQDEALPPESRREAALALAEACAGNGRKQEALQALRALEGFGPLDLELTGRKTQLLLTLGDVDAYLAAILPVVDASLRRAGASKGDPRQARLVAQARRRQAAAAGGQAEAAEQGSIFKGYVTNKRKRKGAAAAEQAAEPSGAAADADAAEAEAEEGGPLAPALLSNLAKSEEQYKTVMQVARVLLQSGRPLKAAEILSECVSKLTVNKRGYDKSKKDVLRLFAAEAALAAREPTLAAYHLRLVAERWPGAPHVWNGFAEAAAQAGSLRPAQKTAASLRQGAGDCAALCLVHGHCLAFSNALGRAVAEYAAAHAAAPECPLALLCLGTAHLAQAASRRVPDRDRAVLAAFAFLQNYARRRSNQQEALYNLGRAAHALGLAHLAVPWYQRALAAPVPAPLQRPLRAPLPPGSLDLRREIAHNLCLIYRGSGAGELARQLMRKHLTV